MTQTPHKYYAVVDLEATCCEIKSITREQMEIIEIGAVMVDGETLRPVDEYQTFIKPVRNPQLTPFCTALTTITQEDVDGAPGFAEAIKDFSHWLCKYDNYVFCSWGDFDKNQFEQDCKYHNVPYPFASEHFNIKKLFSDCQGLPKRYGLKGALRLAGLTLEGTHHRGIDDARNMVPLMPFILGRGSIPLSGSPL